MTAAGTQAVEFEPVGLYRKTVAGCDFFLELLDFTILKFHDLAAARADEVIVMTLVRDIVVLRL